ncbi:uncharacterized protein LOC122040090 [Zingiber officinale]|uniref:DUF7804 domain-containing protein n=1 Tax=Zingiber officinale TaxID=94328 RepID=A0A8J5LQ91_ZINOF|nr:uncharacterized protein LOC122040090 [Zingiber officinale]KAG6529490.1 hypothetical protein ZIOFF_011689 [Zingiber officinale]
MREGINNGRLTSDGVMKFRWSSPIKGREVVSLTRIAFRWSIIDSVEMTSLLCRINISPMHTSAWLPRRRKSSPDPVPEMLSARWAQLSSFTSCVTPESSFTPMERAMEAVYDKKKEEEEAWNRVVVTPEKLEQWMRDSIGEIVRNISDGPFLMHVFSDGGLRLEREAAASERWKRIRKRWDEERRVPDAVVLVKELPGEEEEVEAVVRRKKRTWGLVVQGRGMDGAVCYILDTTRVQSSVGFCTHFCLVRAQSSGEAADVQLTNAWLQGRQ